MTSACSAPASDSPGAAQAPDEVPPFEFDEVTVDDLQRMMESGEHTARSITQAYIERIEKTVCAPIAVISTGPDREETIVLEDLF